MKKTIDLNNYKFSGDENILLDTNIIWFSYGAQKGSDERIVNYTEVFSNTLKNGCSLYITNAIISEFINSQIKIMTFNSKLLN